MNITADCKAMLKAVNLVAGVPSARAVRAILANLLLQVEADDLDALGGPVAATISATDIELGIVVKVPGVQADRCGSAMLPTDRIKKALGLSASETVTIEDYAGELRVTTNCHHVFARESTDTFPAIPSFDSSDFFVVAARDLRRALRRTVFAVDPNSTKYAIAGCLLDFATPGWLLVAGTDGRRIAQQVIPCEIEGNAISDNRPIIPVKAVNLIDRLISDEDPPVHLAFAPNVSSLLLRTHNATIYTRLNEGRYPKYDKVLLSDPPHRVELETASLAMMVDQALVSTSEESNGLTWTFSSGSLVISSVSADVGRSDAEMPIEFGDPTFTVKLNGPHAAMMLKVMDESVAIEFIDNVHPVMFLSNDGYIHVLNPMIAGPIPAPAAVKPAKGKAKEVAVA